MNKVFTGDRLIIFFIILIISLNIAGATTKGVLDGDKLTITNESLIKGSNYTVQYINEQITIMRFDATAYENGSVEIQPPNLSSEIRITEVFVVDRNNTPVTEKISLDNLKPPFEANTQVSKPKPTKLKPTPPESTPPEPTQSLIGGFKEFILSWTFIIILALFILILVIYYFWNSITKLLTGNDDISDGQYRNPIQMQSDLHKLKVELMDESGIRLSGKIVKAIIKNSPFPQTSSRSDNNGECTLELLRGKYSIIAEGEEKYESVSKEINIKGDENIQLTLTRRQLLQIEVVDESGAPLRGIKVRVLEAPTYVDIISPIETDNNGIAKLFLSKNKQYVTSIQSPKDEFIKQEKMPINNSETIKRIQLIKRTGTLEVTVTEQATGKTFAGIPVMVTKKGTNSINEFLTNDAGKINEKILVGDYVIRLKPGSFSLYESSEKYTAVTENRMSKIILDFRFNYQDNPQDRQLINSIKEKLETSYKEVSAYDKCIPLFFKRVGEKPTQLVESITKRPVEFLGAKTSPNEMISYILKTAEFISGEISRIMREKSNVDFYYSIQNLDPVNDDLNVSDYSQEKFRELVRDVENYHKNHKTEIGNKLHEIDGELTKFSVDLNVQPVADLWRVAQKLQENSLNESDIKKRGVMLFLNDKLLDHVREMYNKEEVKARLKFTMV